MVNGPAQGVYAIVVCKISLCLHHALNYSAVLKVALDHFDNCHDTKVSHYAGSYLDLKGVHIASFYAPHVLEISLKTCVYLALKFDTESISELISICGGLKVT